MSNEDTKRDDFAADADSAIQWRFERELASLTATQNGSLKQLIGAALPEDRRDVFDTGMASWADAIASCAREYHGKWIAISKGTAEERLAAAGTKIRKAIQWYLRIPSFQAEQWNDETKVRASIRDVCLSYGQRLPAWFSKKYLTSSKLQWPVPPTHLPEDKSHELRLEAEKQFAGILDRALFDVFCDGLIDTAVQGAPLPLPTRQMAAGAPHASVTEQTPSGDSRFDEIAGPQWKAITEGTARKRVPDALLRSVIDSLKEHGFSDLYEILEPKGSEFLKGYNRRNNRSSIRTLDDLAKVLGNKAAAAVSIRSHFVKRLSRAAAKS